VLLAAGVGATPMLAMLRHIVFEGLRKRRVRPTWFFLSAHALQDQAFGQELADLVESGGGAIQLIRLLSDPDRAEQGKHFDEIGRIDVALLCRTLPFNDFDFYLCGPTGFMQSIYDGLRGLNVADARIHAESFGPSSLTRKPDATAVKPPAKKPATHTVSVVFTSSGKEARWSPGDGSLLELAEARGLSPAFSCRSGTCGSCRTRIVEGDVAYENEPEFKPAAGEALLCCAVPADGAGADGRGADRLQLDV
jgi:ferredoxin-NADP reductase